MEAFPTLLANLAAVGFVARATLVKPQELNIGAPNTSGGLAAQVKKHTSSNNDNGMAITKAQAHWSVMVDDVEKTRLWLGKVGLK